ncbi:MAG: FeoB small GTPase domain-containing protein [Bacillota bacterium]
MVKKVALVGNPNVGKSVIFNSLTGAYVTVSNYPGTTVEVSRGRYAGDDVKLEIIDTPGMYSMIPISEEENVTRKLLLNEKPDIVMHVIDAKNIERMLPLTLQLLEAGFKTILVLNIMDEAKALGINIDCDELQKLLGIPVVEASAALNIGIREIKKILGQQARSAA